MDLQNPILKKMRLKPEQKILVLNAPNRDWEVLFSNSNADTGKVFDVVIAFAINKAALEHSITEAKKILAENGSLWLAFPKGTSKLETDLSRDKVYELIPETEWKFLTLISLDSDWSAFSFRKQTGATKAKESTRNQAKLKESDLYVNKITRKITLPEDLETVLNSDEDAKAYFDKLAFSHRREYVVWIAEAKKAETRQRRLEKMLEMLQRGAKNPADKTISTS